MNRWFALWIVAGLVGSLSAQFEGGISEPDTSIPILQDFADNSYKLSTTITAKDLKEHIFALANDSMQGRETGTHGNRRAAEYIAAKFKKLDLPQIIGSDHGYFQQVPFTFTGWVNQQIVVGGKKLRAGQDFLSYPRSSISLQVQADSIAFVGYGIDDKDYSDYTSEDVGPVAIAYDGEPRDSLGKFILTGTKSSSDWSLTVDKKAKAAKERGVEVLFVISNNYRRLLNQDGGVLTRNWTELGFQESPEGCNVIFISTTVAKSIFGDQIDQIIAERVRRSDGENPSPYAITIPTFINQALERRQENGQNIIGYIKGTDLRDQLVVVSAHYDHIGTYGNEVYNGADDNASGTTTVLEIAEAIQTAVKLGLGPRRSVLCLLVTGEEKGLLGSQWYADHPVFPLETTMVDVNIDMQGRTDNKYMKQDVFYNYVIGSDRISQDLHDLNEEINETYTQMTLDYTYNDENDPNRIYYRSDHYNFAKNGIPSIFFFSGLHPDYHRLTDTPDKIEIDLLKKRARHSFHLIWALANQENPLRISVK
ncbi:MAG: M28 family peptidase [Bacteroidota bacterium]